METLRTYTYLSRLKTFQDRFAYLRLEYNHNRIVFGGLRYLNQRFYTSSEWRSVRQEVIVRDRGCDLGLSDFPIDSGAVVYVHHMNPMSIETLYHDATDLLNPEYLITVSKRTHDGIHFGFRLFEEDYAPRREGDTMLW